MDLSEMLVPTSGPWPSFQEVMDAVAKMREMPRASFDCIVCTEVILFSFPRAQRDALRTLDGLPVYVEANEDDALARAFDLSQKNRRPLLLHEKAKP
jgi:hypothetical protein